MRLLAMLLLLVATGCATTHEGIDVGPYAGADTSGVPLCSKVTVSCYSGPNRWIECRVR